MGLITQTIRQDMKSLNKMAKQAAKASAKPNKKHGLRLGAIPTLFDLAPVGFTDTALPATSLLSGTLLAHAANLPVGDCLLAGAATALVMVIGRRFETAQQRRGCLLKEGGVFIREAWETESRKGNVDPELSKIYKKVLGDDNTFVELRQSEQYNIHVVYNDNPKNVRANLEKIAIQLNVDPIQMIFRPVWGRGCSAVLTHRPKEEWMYGKQAVAFDESAVIPGRMILQAGRSITGETMTYDRELYPHALFTGESGAGKTEAMVADIYASRKTGLNPIVYIIDPKNTEQLSACNPDIYENDAVNAISLLESVVKTCEKRMTDYRAAGCSNFFKYREKHPSERPICLYIDEVAEMVSPDVCTDKAKAKKISDAALALITRIAQKYRSVGLFMSLGMQHPLAKVLTTNVRNNIGIRIALSVQDHDAAKVAGVPGSENLPMQGAMIVKLAKEVTYGRGVYLTKN